MLHLVGAFWQTDMAFWKNFASTLVASLGIEHNTTTHLEKLISALGALLGILTVYWVSQWYLHTEGMLLMVASMGASAVLLFAVPHGALSQPWPVLGGHLLSAFIGVSCHKFCPDHALAPALAVGLAVGAMHYLRCLHPPGGATALSAIIGGEQIHAMGYDYLLTPILLNVLAILLVAFLFNGLFPWRRYPAHIVKRHAHRHLPAQLQTGKVELTHEDLAAAIQQLNSYIDVTSEDLAELFELALQHAREHGSHPASIIGGRFYSNGQSGERWCVRQVIDIHAHPNAAKERVIFKNVAGAGAYDTGICRTDEFREWARFEVDHRNGQWVRLEQSRP